MRSQLDLDGLQHLLWSFAPHRILTVAGRTGLLRLLAGRTATSEEAAAELGLDPGAAGKVVRSLNALGVVEPDGAGYRVVERLASVMREGPDDLLPFFEHSHAMYERWGANLEPWLRGEGWESAPRTPEETRRFGQAMKAMGGQMARRVAAVLDLTGVRRLLDVGGGLGHFSLELCRANPGLDATVLDIPEVASRGAEQIAGVPEGSRIAFVGGDYLESDYGSGHDVVLLANVLHQELEDGAAAMIQKAAAALAPGGRVVVVDFAIDDERREHPLGTLFAINMRSFGDTYTAPTILGWMRSAGLEPLEPQTLGSDRWILSARRPG